MTVIFKSLIFQDLSSQSSLLYLLAINIQCPCTLSVSRREQTLKLSFDCEVRGTDNVQGQISVHILEDKWRLLCLFSFKYFFTRPLC